MLTERGTGWGPSEAGTYPTFLIYETSEGTYLMMQQSHSYLPKRNIHAQAPGGLSRTFIKVLLH